ncbi:DEAD-domain-containing protein [Rhizopogon salebrosus TDB-379]|nr:DEAD-domain-containing protein [Rhizopogon salebrosus TDB-379]
MQPQRWSLMHRSSGLLPPQHISNSIRNYGISANPLLHHRLHHNYGDDFAGSEDDIDSSPSPPERVGGRTRAFASHPPTSQVFPSIAVQSHWRDGKSPTPEYTPSPIDTSVQAQNQTYYPQGIHHPRQPSGENYLGNSNIDNFESHFDMQIENRQTSGYSHVPVGRTRQKSQAVQLRPVSELSDRFRSVFKFGVFNAIQSTCFDAVLHSNENMVISAPTGSGKTVLFELSIIRMVTNPLFTNKAVKCVYVAPTKALCTEKHKEWTSKFGGLGIHSCELTGDTVVFGKGVWGDAKNAQIM